MHRDFRLDSGTTIEYAFTSDSKRIWKMSGRFRFVCVCLNLYLSRPDSVRAAIPWSWRKKKRQVRFLKSDYELVILSRLLSLSSILFSSPFIGKDLHLYRSSHVSPLARSPARVSLETPILSRLLSSPQCKRNWIVICDSLPYVIYFTFSYFSWKNHDSCPTPLSELAFYFR